MGNHLFLNRLLIVTEDGDVAYDEVYHKGVNIIRGDNSSGKSTITHFIFFVLGGAFNDFVLEARQCAVVYAEVEMNNAIFTIKRYLEKDEDGTISAQAPLYFFWDKMEVSLNPSGEKGWQKFGYKLTENRKSFSNVLFENVGLPIVKGDSNITFHQILRLLYIDQESPTSSLFYYEKFDSQLTRETVSDLLLGVYNERLYENKKRLVAAEKELDRVRAEVRALSAFFQDPLTLDPSHLAVVIENKEKDILKIQDEIVDIRAKRKEVVYDTMSKLGFERLNDEAISQRQIVNNIENEISVLEDEIEDSTFFIETLDRKIDALRNSIETRDFLGNLPLDYCPECLSRLNEPADRTKCKLCKETVDQSFGIVQARRMEQEIGFQIHESRKLLELNQATLLKLQSRLTAEKGKLHDIQQQVNLALRDVKSFNEEVVDSLNMQKGFLEGEILQFRTMLEKAELYKKLVEKENALVREVSQLRSYIYRTEQEQTRLKEEITAAIKTEGVYLLNNDLDRQDEFKNANDFFIDFSNNITFLSNKYSKYSASSNFYLKVAARFAIFLASLIVERMRYPRFIFADNMEDKGIEMQRAQNLQKLLIQRLKKYRDEDYQLIYTTSYITKELNESPLVVGEYYSKSNPTLKNIKSH